MVGRHSESKARGQGKQLRERRILSVVLELLRLQLRLLSMWLCTYLQEGERGEGLHIGDRIYDHKGG